MTTIFIDDGKEVVKSDDGYTNYLIYIIKNYSYEQKNRNR